MAEPGLSRRDLFKIGGGVALGLGVGKFEGAGAGTHRGGVHVVGAPPAFQVPLAVPSPLAPTSSDETTDYYDLTVRQAQLEILPGTRTTVWGYDGQFPGPMIVAQRDRETVVRQVNQLDVPITTHLHGGHTPASSDGYPTDLFWPGESRTYRYPNHQHAATLWYHDHRADHTAEQVWMGLAGLYVLHDDIERALPLPTGAYDVPLVIQDRLFEPDGAFSYPTTARDLMEGVLGNVLIVNGRPQPYFEVAARRYRFRILNGSNARTYRLSLSSGGTFTQVASGGGLLPHPVDHTSFMIGPGERYEMVVDFSALPVGSRVVLQNELGSGSTAQVMRFDVTRHESDPSSVPADLAPYTLLDPADATVTRRFTLDRAHGVWTINSLPWDPDRVDARPALGDAEVWEFHARGGPKMVHTMHLHLVQFQVLSRNGAPPESWESGWKDTVFVAGGDTVRVITRFSDYRGRYPFHCHILEHEDHAMMAQFETV